MPPRRDHRRAGARIATREGPVYGRLRSNGASETAMTLKRRTALGLSVAALAQAPAIVRAQPAIKLDLSTVSPDGSLHAIHARTFADEVRKATGGAVDIS